MEFEERELKRKYEEKEKENREEKIAMIIVCIVTFSLLFLMFPFSRMLSKWDSDDNEKKQLSATNSAVVSMPSTPYIESIESTK